MSEQAIWFYESKGKREGSISTTEIIELITQGVIHQGTQVWKKGMTEWVTLEESELAQYLEDVPPPLSNNDVPPPLQTVLTPKSNEESFSTKLGGIWRFIYAPTFAAIATYLVSYLIEGSSRQAFGLWSTSGMAVISLLIILTAWAEDLWRFKKSASYTGWSWWWLFAPCYIHDRMGKQWKWTIGLIVLSLVCNLIASAAIALHGDGYFDDNDSYSYQPQSNAQVGGMDLNTIELETYLNTTNTDAAMTGHISVVMLDDVTYRISYSNLCGSNGCDYSYLKSAQDGGYCYVQGNNDAEGMAATQCSSESFRLTYN
ncbi:MULTISPECIES: DUF4339 domain-containing protein [Aliivibrio]|uniref:DUF4339 domain-containing protein n=1 Tax=Aliivibrio finisterrensis TaxID=511998 RepID=A0A4Q5KV75_9GAMM|nr:MULTISPECIES: DUF4339 domain-containing protein [Aliivibrio]MDD9176304.1 DUF4339 domain-containing protein [Aliivibrio sp. S3TY1]MDD9177916.1 DUF4339 domain-containing protein [Aliivibrio sp. A6]MDD9193317.1 DUF4339 domain-containing protein [Aliivibrio sp. S2TY2]RYU45530.1 DUF4339 domain-containing protein [Aliivibrio finisterrensis]RYU52260.1 DUF4339 domain-containing protein [Aliivibrio finisterrensis]